MHFETRQDWQVTPREAVQVQKALAGQVVTRTMLLEHVWDYHFDPQTNVIDVHIARLRKKIDQDCPTRLIHTVRGLGYRWEVDDGTAPPG